MRYFASVQRNIGPIVTRTLKALGRIVAGARIKLSRVKFSWQKALRFLLLATAIVLFGLVVGGATVVSPPMVPVAIVTIPAALLLWAAPELRRAPLRALKLAFFAVLCVDLCVPSYYAVQIPGSPWISVRRIFLLVLVALFLVSAAGSTKVRERILEVLRASSSAYKCFVLFYVMCALSILTSVMPFQSLSTLSEFTLDWYIPALACILVLADSDAIKLMFKVIGGLSVLVAILGVVDFIGQHNYAFQILPKGLVSAMVETNPALARINEAVFRNGHYRANSVFNVSLSYGEFAALVAPLGAYFVMHGEKPTERALGVIVFVSSLVSLFVSGARGGIVAFLISMSVMVGLRVIRYLRANPRSMVGPLLAVGALGGVTSLVGLLFASKRFHNEVLGGGDAAGSDTSRFVQAQMAWPHILANPVTGHGLSSAGMVIGYTSPGGGMTVDSFVLSLLVETGLPGFVGFFGMLIFLIVAMSRISIFGANRESGLAGALGASILAFTIYRLVLNQHENQPLAFILLGAAFVLAKVAAGRLGSNFAKNRKAGRILQSHQASGFSGAKPAIEPG
ncbi:O-antigen ligase family protein [Rhodoblastus sp.]|uniref:O-antigen ligase family protein n=1 Tax=Rhodoblastus sp. TaxID=1962975 RepID=UPI003F9A48F4